MAQLKRIEADIAALPDTELRRFRKWYDDFDAKRWDSEVGADIANGKLDSLAAEALSEYGAGKCKPL